MTRHSTLWLQWDKTQNTYQSVAMVTMLTLVFYKFQLVTISFNSEYKDEYKLR